MTFDYHGAKQGLLNRYPPPDHDLIIEPFCGSARYSCRYGMFGKNVWINDTNLRIWDVWRRIQDLTPEDIESLPDLTGRGESLADHQYLSHTDRDMLGFATGAGRASPSDRVALWAANKGATAKLKYDIRRLCGRIRHWKVTCMDYQDIPNQEACWFVDAPYEHFGKNYTHNDRGIDFNRLRDWCLERRGQIIVCESSEAKWLPFVPIKEGIKRTNREDDYTEVIYCRSDKQA